MAVLIPLACAFERLPWIVRSNLVLLDVDFKQIRLLHKQSLLFFTILAILL